MQFQVSKEKDKVALGDYYSLFFGAVQEKANINNNIKK